MVDMVDTPEQFNDAAWQDIGDGFVWECVSPDGTKWAEVTFEEDRGQRWSWYVALPEEWHYAASSNPSGLARSADAAKAICEAMLLGTFLKR